MRNISKEYSLDVIGQKYFNCEKDRAYTLYFSVPDNPGAGGRKMGICLLIAGFGADANASVYRKMRREFADRENLVVVQCDYFGYEFMGRELDAKIEKEVCNLKMFFSPEECRNIESLPVSRKYQGNMLIQSLRRKRTFVRWVFCRQWIISVP